jgi:hypothetical protein
LEADLFVADALPSFAKSYILPRKMRKDSVEARKKKFSAAGDLDDEESSAVEVKTKAFKLSMLKTSLQIEAKKLASEADGVSSKDTLKTLKMAKIAVSKWKKKVEARKEVEENSVGTINFLKRVVKTKTNSVLTSPVKTRKTSRSRGRSKLPSETGSTGSGTGNVSGRMSRNRSHKSLVPCAGPGQLIDYSQYVKSGKN